MTEDTKIGNWAHSGWEQDEKFMLRAMDLARMGMGNVAPNPMVGCVIVHDGRIIGEGYHRRYGEAHAEVNAVEAVHDRSLLRQSTVYVTLEPCSHFGKTPPCADLLIRLGVPRVVVGTVDPNEKVAGKGIARLREAGAEVLSGLLEKECAWMNRRFFTFHQKRRPYIILKWARTEDGFIDKARSEQNFGQPSWITNDLSRIAVHKMRSDEAAILVGTNTALKDNPSLTVRDWAGHHPLRLVLDRTGRLPDTLALFDGSTETIIFTEREFASQPNREYVRMPFDETLLDSLLAFLYERGIQSLLVEGGRKLLDSFIQRNLWDEARVYIGNTRFGEGIKAPELRWQHEREESLDDSLMRIYYKND
ncbi:MAG: bifunctional diaminohydroxyphosphoribosylaminopyrimidine deaminase/5-amino-6-(5-phosphoribosylamino)uracil reductase RibD [Marinilabiliales bacterium]|nr:bifunctional diaminohydroxyphosphoribosylaminopyrimidine deaminase/5-amino-6-(5-phosphoribosylamino)uracil reductase RibD [Marinilabiliales bacterium]